MKAKTIAILGLGRFGGTLAKELESLNQEVLGVDSNEELVQKHSNYLTHTVIADVTDIEVLKSLSLNQFDTVVVSIADDIRASLMTTMLLKELGIKSIIAKAKDSLHGKMLEKIGADIVIYPERDMALRLAQQVIRENVVDYLKIAPDVGLVELEVPDILVGISLKESKLREDYNLSVVAIKIGDDVEVPPNPTRPLDKRDKLLIIGHDEDILRLSK